MVIQVNQELCEGCGTCLDACTVGAIYFVDHRAAIDEALCTQCEACVEVCPNCAIKAIPTPIPQLSTALPSKLETQMIPVQKPLTSPEATSSSRNPTPLVDAALGFLGREVAPRLVDVLISGLEHKLIKPAATCADPPATLSQNSTAKYKGSRRQLRHRRRHSGKVK